MSLRRSIDHADGTPTTPSSTGVVGPQLKAHRRRSLNLKAFLTVTLPGVGGGGSSSALQHHAPSPATADASPIVGHGVLPADLVISIGEMMSTSDVLSFSLASKHTHQILLPTLYSTLILRTSSHCIRTLPFLLTRPDLCALIKKMAVRPNYYLAWPQEDEWVDEEEVARMVGRLASLGRRGMEGGMRNLESFDWDGREVMLDWVWKVLRDCCPKLKNIYTNVGSNPLDPYSELFSFRNLSTFSLTTRHGLSPSSPHPHPLLPAPTALPARLWDMLLRHSASTLEELTICSFSSTVRVWAYERLAEGRWERLKSLTLGGFGWAEREDGGWGVGWGVDGGEDEEGDGDGEEGDNAGHISGLRSFLTAHPNLTYLRLLFTFHCFLSPPTMPLHLPPTALPNLTTFIGIYQHLLELPEDAVRKVEYVDLTGEAIYWGRAKHLSRALTRCTSIKTLDLWMHVAPPRGWPHRTTREDAEGEGEGEGEGLEETFKEIMKSVPGLEEFHFMCTTSFGIKSLNALLTPLPLLPHLTRFSLTKGHAYTDESMLATAVRVVRAHAGVRVVNVRWARERCLNHLKGEGAYDVVFGRGGGAGSGEREEVKEVKEVGEGEGEGEGEREGRMKLLRRRSSAFFSLNNNNGKRRPSTLSRPISSLSLSDPNDELLSPATFTSASPFPASSSSSSSPITPPTATTTTTTTLRPIALLAHERAIPLLGAPFEKRYRYELDHPGVRFFKTRRRKV